MTRFAPFPIQRDRLQQAVEKSLSTSTERMSGVKSSEELFGALSNQIISQSEAVSAPVPNLPGAEQGQIVGERPRSLSMRIRQKLYSLPVVGRLFLILRHLYFLPRLAETHQSLMVELQSLQRRQDALQDHLEERVRDVSNETVAITEGLTGLHRKSDHMIAKMDETDVAQRRTALDLVETNEKLEEQAEALKALQASMNRKLSRMATDLASKGPAVISGEAQSVSTESTNTQTQEQLAHLFDDFYTAYENLYRGERAEIKERCEVYLPDVRDAQQKAGAAPVVDLGCGRGEWLELLKEKGFDCMGVELNDAQADTAREHGLNVKTGDALAWLHVQDEESLLGVTAMHVIEHLPFETNMALFADAYSALKPGGIAIFETPDPENLMVGAHSFYRDPTHIRPLPSALMAFAMEYAGFTDVEVRRLHPTTRLDELKAHEKMHPEIADLIYGPQDYAIIGHKKGNV